MRSRPLTRAVARRTLRPRGVAPTVSGATRALLGAFVLLVAFAATAEARLSIIPGRPGGGPRPTPRPTPIVTSSKSACQEQIRSQSAQLAGGVRAAFSDCLKASLPCVLDQAGAPSCCAGVAPACAREAQEISAAGAAFVAAVTGPVCSTVAFADLVGEDGLDFGRTGDACMRLEPPVAVDGLGSLATCLERLVIEDVLHLAATVEQPRALEALVCMDLEDLFPGVTRERPASCEELPVATPSPSPTPVATPTAVASPGSSPTPAVSPGGPTPTGGAPTPTPAGATPTPGGATCTEVEVIVAVNYNTVDVPDMGGITVALGYPAGIAIPGVGSQPAVLERVTQLNSVSGGLFSAGDTDGGTEGTAGVLSIGLISPVTPIAPGNFARARFDCTAGAAPSVSAFTCSVDASANSGNPAETHCVLTVTSR